MKRLRKGWHRSSGHLEYYLWLLPAILLLSFFLVIPTFQTFYLSLHQEVTFSESQFRQDLLEQLASGSGREVSKDDLFMRVPGWNTVLAKVESKYKIKTAPGDLNAEMTVKDTAEMFTVAINQAQRDKGASQEFVGLKNYGELFKDQGMLTALKNNLLWLVFFTAFTIVLGLLIAALADRVKWGTLAKTIVFLPMSISGAASAVIWYFMFVKDVHTGTVNAIISLFSKNFSGVAFLGRPDLVNFALITAGVWMQVGFCTVIFSAALQSVPVELLEMARIEGAKGRQIFFRIELPVIRSTIVLVITQMIMWVLKVFDIIYTLTQGGPFGASEVIANRIYRTEFNLSNFQYGSAMAVVLFVAIIPILFLNVRNLAREESIRE